jgi:hypothetical protein
MKAQCPRFIPRLELLEARNLLDVNSLAPLPAPWVQVFHGDFNGDGKQDVAGIDSSGQWWVSLSTGTSFTPRTKWAQWSIPTSRRPGGRSVNDLGWADLFVADVNGDGKDDIVGFDATGKWWVGLSDGKRSFVTGMPWAQWSIPASWRQVFVGDFNGDHKLDVAGLGNNGAWFVGLSNGADSFSTGAAWAHWSIGPSWSQFLVGDFNGDGKKDVAGLGFNGTWFVGLSNGINTFATGAAWAQWSDGASWQQIFVGDFNGDKKDDIAGFGVNGLWFVGLSNGTNHFNTGAAWANWSNDFFGVPGSTVIQAFVSDLNGDGKSDIVGFVNIPGHFEPAEGDTGGIVFFPATGSWYSFESNGASFSDPGPDAVWSQANTWSQLMLADFTGDGFPDIGGFANSPAWTVGRSNAILGGGWGPSVAWAFWGQ